MKNRATISELQRAGVPASNTAGARRDLAVVPEYDNLRIVGLYDRYFKRLFDLAGSAVLIAVLAPVIGGVALAVRIFMGPHIFFYQSRVGRNGVPFQMIKFRSMHHDRRATDESPEFDGDDRRLTHKSTDDPRHTPLGRFIRKWSLDELPQLFNVFRGEMSLVGPRPELVKVAMAHNLIDHPRHLVRPGITGLWQVSGQRDELLHQNVEIDIDYVRRVTFRGDLRILFQTAGAVLRARGR